MLTEGMGDFALPPGGTKNVEVAFAPSNAGSFEGAVVVSHNASNEPDPVEVELTGEGVPAPELAFTPEIVDVSIAINNTAVTGLKVSNAGSAASTLEYSFPAFAAQNVLRQPGTTDRKSVV